jgi:hypothetical protein
MQQIKPIQKLASMNVQLYKLTSMTTQKLEPLDKTKLQTQGHTNHVSFVECL